MDNILKQQASKWVEKELSRTDRSAASMTKLLNHHESVLVTCLDPIRTEQVLIYRELLRKAAR